jgi:hypothetical protein
MQTTGKSSVRFSAGSDLAQLAAASRSQPQPGGRDVVLLPFALHGILLLLHPPLPALLLRDLVPTRQPKKRTINQRPLPTRPTSELRGPHGR